MTVTDFTSTFPILAGSLATACWHAHCPYREESAGAKNIGRQDLLYRDWDYGCDGLCRCPSPPRMSPQLSRRRLQGNKGATAVRLTVASTTLAFVNAHLAAFDEMTAKRNADFHDLSRRLVFSMAPASEPNTTAAAVARGETVFESDVLFWLASGIYLMCLQSVNSRPVMSSILGRSAFFIVVYNKPIIQYTTP